MLLHKKHIGDSRRLINNEIQSLIKSIGGSNKTKSKISDNLFKKNLLKNTIIQ